MTTTTIGTRKRKFWAGLRNNGASTSSAGSGMVTSLDDIAVVHARLRDTLDDLGVSPERIFGRRLTATDRDSVQSRLQMSCKSWHNNGASGEVFPFDQLLTLEEKLACNTSKPKTVAMSDEQPKKKNNATKTKTKPIKGDDDNHVDNDGLLVQAYDRTGKPYVLRLKYIKKSDCYRLMYQWTDFLKNHNLVVKDDTKKTKKNKAKKKRKKKVIRKVAMADEAMIDLWVFRSWKLKYGRDDHEDGRLGLVMVHYFKGDAPYADAALEANDEELVQARPRKKKSRRKDRKGAMSSSSSQCRTRKTKQPWRLPSAMAGEDEGGAVRQLAEIAGEGAGVPHLPTYDPEMEWAAGVLLHMRNFGRW
uniref:TF-B3 domain-containing protein n=1 Tax=Oryza brachyantha TaxID=4533 RepID=J3MWC8_ORYBR